jgi:hypothetical protein
MRCSMFGSIGHKSSQTVFWFPGLYQTQPDLKTGSSRSEG